jgi:hypothetical protein
MKGQDRMEIRQTSTLIELLSFKHQTLSFGDTNYSFEIAAYEGLVLLLSI